MLYREPADLVCTDNEQGIEKILQACLWRWKIEVNFREEKTILGCGQAQVWTKAIGMNFSGNVNHELKTQGQRNEANPFTSAMFYMRN